MSQIHNTPVHVTGEERRHPAIRQLARACIALARQQIEAETTTDKPTEVTPVARPVTPGEEGDNA